MQRSPIRMLLPLVALLVLAAGCVELQQKVVDGGTTPPADTAAEDVAGGDAAAGTDTVSPDVAADAAAGDTDAVGDDTPVAGCAGDAVCNREGVCAALPGEAEAAAVCENGAWVCDYSGVQDYEATEASCDAVDNDCDGQTDESLTASAEDGRCRRFGVCGDAPFAICRGGDWVCVYTEVVDFEQTELSCDAKDNDCDGQTDEGLERGCGSACGPGLERCEGGAWVGCDAPQPADEICDGKDNDCDGQTDLTAAGEPLATPGDFACPDVGVCEGADPAPTVACVADGEGGASWVCDFGDLADHEVDEVSCDDLDNDCDGDTDEAITQPESLQGICDVVGVCGEGVVATCDGGAWECAYDGVADYEAEEVTCDGLDNDCDGDTDEGVDAATDPTAPECPALGVCEGQIEAACQRGKWNCPTTGVPDYEDGSETSCDGLDNDCDGQTDEALTVLSGPPVAACLRAGVCGDGVFALCVDASWRCIYPEAREPVEASCDGLDNDCDGQTDENLTGSLADCATPPVGVCDDPAASVTCEGGDWRCNFTPIASFEQDETMCDGLDNDCDGATDEDTAGDPLADATAAECLLRGVCTTANVVAVCNGAAGYACDYTGVSDYEAGTETLCDGLDNDCDGDRDEGLDGDPVAADCDLTGVCTPASVGASCDGAPGFSCDYSAVSDWEAVETLCDGLDNDCDGTTDVGLTEETSTTDCPTTGVCAAGVPAICEGAGWTCLFAQVAEYEAVETLCDELDNDCDGTTDVGVCTGPGASCEGNDGCDSSFCRTDLDGEGMFCAADATGCVLDTGAGVDQVAEGTPLCATDTTNRTCAAGEWAVAAACPTDTPFCLDTDGACHLCQPGAQRCNDGTTIGACDAAGDTFAASATCDVDTVCAGGGTCFTTVVGTPAATPAGAQVGPAVAWQDTGTQQNLIVVWTEPGADDADVTVRRVSAATGTTVLLEQTLALPGDQSGVDVVTDPTGVFMVGFTSGDADQSGVYLQRFSTIAFKSGDVIPVNTETTGAQEDLRLAPYRDAGDDSGAVVAVFASATDGIFYRRFSVATGTPVDATETAVSEGADRQKPDVAAAPDGRFAVVWQAPDGGGGGAHDVWLRLYMADGAPVDVATTVAPGVTGIADGPLPRVEFVASVGWIVAWKEDLGGGADGQIVARVYGEDGLAVGDAFTVVTGVGTDAGAVALAADPTTGQVVFLFADIATPDDASGSGITAVGVDAGADPVVVSAAVRVNDVTDGVQTAPAAAAGATGAFISAWETPDTDASGIATRLLLFP